MPKECEFTGDGLFYSEIMSCKSYFSLGYADKNITGQIAIPDPIVSTSVMTRCVIAKHSHPNYITHKQPQIYSRPKMERNPQCSSCWKWWTFSPTTCGRPSTGPPRSWTSTTPTSSWRAWRASTWSCRTSPSPWSRSWWTAGTPSSTA